MEPVMRTQDWRKLSSVKEWINKQGNDEVAKFRIYNPKTNMILEGWKNLRTKARLLTERRRPEGREELELRTRADSKGRIIDIARATREFLDAKR
jgi:hypothetical protein